MSVLVTGAAGFIGFHVAQLLLERGERVIGVDNLNPYYDVRLKEARLDRIRDKPGFVFHQIDISDKDAIKALFEADRGLDRVVHLAAQAGVRYSLIDPYAYIQANIVGQIAILEGCRHQPGFKHLVYASSSSVYGGNTKLPFSVHDRVDQPVSLYAATKRADELMGAAYSHLFGTPMTGLRFFTVYGPWGRPDMSAFLFTKAILAGEPIRVFNHGNMKRDFTYVDDIAAGVVAALDRVPEPRNGGPPHRVYNLGNHRSEPLLRFIETIEQACGRKAEVILEPMQPGDVPETYADIDDAVRDLDFSPSTSIDVGIPNFVRWYKEYHGAIA